MLFSLFRALVLGFHVFLFLNCFCGLCFEGIANVRCLITRMISWYNVKGARIGKTRCILLYFVVLLCLEFGFCLFRCLFMYVEFEN